MREWLRSRTILIVPVILASVNAFRRFLARAGRVARLTISFVSHDSPPRFVTLVTPTNSRGRFAEGRRVTSITPIRLFLAIPFREKHFSRQESVPADVREHLRNELDRFRHRRRLRTAGPRRLAHRVGGGGAQERDLSWHSPAARRRRRQPRSTARRVPRALTHARDRRRTPSAHHR